MKKKLIGSILAVSLLSSQAMPVLAVSDKSNIGINANTETPMEIVYGGEKWKVIGYNGDGVASTADTVTLFASDKVGKISFKIDGSSNNYNGSDLQVAVDAIYDGFADREKNAVITRHLEGGSANNAKKGMAGADVNAKLWPLDVDEANAVNGKLRRVDKSYWLRSPGSREGYASLADDFGTVSARGIGVQTNLGVRPAYQLKLSSIIFTSEAVDGKSSTVSDVMVPLGNTSGLQKLTIVDNELNSGTITAKKVNGTNSKVNINVRGATASKNVSAIITDSTGAVTHYATIGTTDGSGNASDLALTLPVTLDNDHILKIFVEKINGDNETDYASTPVAVITDKEKVDKAKSLADTAISNLSITNDTTKENILETVNTVIASVNGVSAAWKSGSPVITPATSAKAGSITGTIILTSGSEIVEVVVNKVIAKLPKTDTEKLAEAKPLAETAIEEITATNITTTDNVLNAVKTAVTSVNGISATWKDGSPVIIPATSAKAGSITGTIILSSGSETVEVTVNKVIMKLPVTPVGPPKPDLKKPSTPQTGDTSNSGFLICFMAISGGAVVFGLKRKIKSIK